MKLIDMVDILRGNLKAANSRRFMTEADSERIREALSGGDPKARKILEEVTHELAKRGVTGEPLVAVLAAFHKIGFSGRALVQAFEANDYSFERTYYRGVFALIRSEFPFVSDYFATEPPTSEEGEDPAPEDVTSRC